jgi:hypothetical protein
VNRTQVGLSATASFIGAGVIGFFVANKIGHHLIYHLLTAALIAVLTIIGLILTVRAANSNFYKVTSGTVIAHRIIPSISVASRYQNRKCIVQVRDEQGHTAWFDLLAEERDLYPVGSHFGGPTGNAERSRTVARYEIHPH